MRVTIHQPSYLPWLPFLEKGLQSDVYVLLDDAQFEKNGFQNRNRIKTAAGAAWLTVPVSHDRDTPLNQVRIADVAGNWRRKHLRTIEESYARAPHYATVAPAFAELLHQSGDSLCALNIAMARLFLSEAGFRGEIALASELGIAGGGSQRVLDICRHFQATHYYAGAAGRDYLDLPSFRAAGIEVLLQAYEPVPYPQCHAQVGFVPHLAALDLLMNVGPREPARAAILAGSHWATAE